LSAFSILFWQKKDDEAWGLGFSDDRYFKLRLLSLHDTGITSFL
jgi:hypothetical protein